MLVSESSARRYALDPDVRLMLEVRDDNAAAFEELVTRYQARLVTLLRHQVGSREQAEDLTQEVFLRVYRARKTYQPGARFATWLYGITVNHAKNRMKQMQSRSHHEVPSLDDPVETENGRLAHDPPSDEVPIVEQLEKKEIQMKVQACINSLEEEYREVLVLRDIQGFSYEEIHDILKIPDGTVKSRLFRAREAMKHCLKKVISDL